MEDLETIEILSTKEQIEEIKESLFWKDVEREMSAWKKGFEIELRGIVDDVASAPTISTAAVLTLLGSIDGRTKAVDYLLDLPDRFLEYLEDKKDDSKR